MSNVVSYGPWVGLFFHDKNLFVEDRREIRSGVISL